jgi:hypothetical protein
VVHEGSQVAVDEALVTVVPEPAAEATGAQQ